MWLILTLHYLGELYPGGGKGVMRFGNFRRMDNGKKRSTEEALLTGKETLFQGTIVSRQMVCTRNQDVWI